MILKTLAFIGIIVAVFALDFVIWLVVAKLTEESEE